eukprot:5167207-Amphidinium_carterae.1
MAPWSGCQERKGACTSCTRVWSQVQPHISKEDAKQRGRDGVDASHLLWQACPHRRICLHSWTRVATCIIFCSWPIKRPPSMPT